MIAIVLDGPSGQVRLGKKIADNISWRVEFDATAPLLAGFEAAKEFAF